MSAHHTVVHVGTPTSEFKDWEWGRRTYQPQAWSSATICFHEFADLPAERGASLESPIFSLLDHLWSLILYPGGMDNIDATEGIVRVGLTHLSNVKRICVECSMTVIDYYGTKESKIRKEFHSFSHNNRSTHICCGSFNRSKIIESTVEGTLIIKVRIKVDEPEFIPENPSACKNLQSLFLDEKFSDLTFEVMSQLSKKNNADTVTKNAPVTFHAHRVIVQTGSPALAELCGSGGEGKISIKIDDVSPDVFHHLLKYIYGGEISNDDMTSHAREIIDVADRYGVSNLKLKAEVYFVEATPITVENAVEHLLYAESKNCALLKEAVMDYIVENKNTILDNISFNDVPSTLMRDLLAAEIREKRRDSEQYDHWTGGGFDEFNALRIGELRWKAHERGLEVDGSRETLIAAIKESTKESTPITEESVPEEN
jgi:hypothetical protein